LYEAGEIDEAMEVASEALSDARQREGNSLQLVNALETLADIQRNEGEFEKAESLYLEALESAQKVGVPLERMARLRSGLAALYDFGQREEQAIPLYEQAISDYDTERPRHDRQAAQLRNNLAMIYKSLGRYALAEQHYLVALEIMEKVWGRSNDRVAAIFNNLGSLYYTAGFAQQAKDMHLDALKIRLEVLGPNDPEVAQSYCNLATACYTLEDMAGMQDNYEKSLAIMESTIDVSSDSYQSAAEDYAGALDSIGDAKKAAAVRKRAEKMLKRV
jgi:tetratricopeptide (TPR) repeat protein